MKSERGGVVWSTFAIIGIVVVLLLLGVCALVNDDDNDADSYGRIQIVASHQYDGGDCEWSGDCGDGYRQDYDQDYGAHDRNRNRNRNRGAFSPGPFDDSPVDAFNGNTICLPGSTCYTDDRRGQDQPPEGQPA